MIDSKPCDYGKVIQGGVGPDGFANNIFGPTPAVILCDKDGRHIASYTAEEWNQKIRSEQAARIEAKLDAIIAHFQIKVEGK